MVILSDIHGELEYANRVASKHGKTLQLGDFGFGFREFGPFNKNLYFFRGNHDNPALVKEHPKWVGDFGLFDNVFFVAGADSIDKSDRIEGVSWWRDEQLSYAQMQDAIDLYQRVKPRYVVSHDGPQSIVESMFGITDRSFTRIGLQHMLDVHVPKMWIFGHHHKSKTFVCQKTKGTFKCLKPDEVFILDETH